MRFIALTSLGLRDELEKEITDLGFQILSKDSNGVSFETDWSGCYLANLKLRTATKVLFPVLEFQAKTPDELYKQVKTFDFSQFINVSDTISIDAHSRDSVMSDQRFIALKTKDAIADFFREKFGERPSVDKENPTMEVEIRVFENLVSVSINTSGSSLSKREYRRSMVEAPLREHLAAGLLAMTNWSSSLPLVDPMCGSGTFLIEAALMATNVAPGSYRKKFAFQGFKNFNQEAWDEIIDKTISEEFDHVPAKIYGFDRDSNALRSAQKNIDSAGVNESVILKRGDIVTLEPPPVLVPGVVIVNPPYGERLGITEELKDIYRDMGFTMKTRFSGWTLYVLSGNDELTKSLKLKAERKIRVYNGGIDCRFLEYKIR